MAGVRNGGAPLAPEVLLADDDVELSGMLKEYLEHDGFRVRVVHDGRSASSAALDGKSEIVVLDVMMPQMDGIASLKEIRKSSRVPVIMLTARGDDIDRIVGLELGADDYVPKPCTPRELAARIRAILRRLHPAPEGAQLACAGIVLWPGMRRAEASGRPLELTSSEFNVLEVLLRRAGTVVTKRELCEAALGRPFARFDRSVDVHVSSLRHKLGDAARLLHTVRGIGYHLATG
ncbi:MAG: response regulator transcription factor [Betaproteobacteria bacterium]|nr:response regulator transcription factor [Betaproteobacteria bacterium]